MSGTGGTSSLPSSASVRAAAGAGLGRKRRALTLRGRLMMILPLLLVLAAVIGWPLLDTVWLSFTDAKLGDASGNFVGIDNYLRALRAPGFLKALGITALFTVLTVSIELFLGLCVGLLLDMELKGRAFFRFLLIVPWALPTVVNAMAWRVIYNPDFGALNALLLQLGIIDKYQSWLGSPATALFAIAAADIWKTFSLVALITLAGLQSVPKELREAATIDGAGFFARFRAVTMPVILLPLSIAAVLRMIEAVKVFDIIWVMTRGGPLDSTKSLSILIYQEAFSFRHAGYGASLAMLSVALSLLLIAGYTRVLRNQPRA
ncbi:sugar ABC transporter permease [Inquilinus sp.]|uniref:carbohydrate ABC transporter permease n=1 Tax=Inquilinus sp. TaxID=1932117 RepID=UPI0031DA8846